MRIRLLSALPPIEMGGIKKEIDWCTEIQNYLTQIKKKILNQLQHEFKLVLKYCLINFHIMVSYVEVAKSQPN